MSLEDKSSLGKWYSLEPEKEIEKHKNRIQKLTAMCIHKNIPHTQLDHFLYKIIAGFSISQGNISQPHLLVQTTTNGKKKEVCLGYNDVPFKDVYDCSRSVSRLFCTVAFPLRFSRSRSFRKRCSSSSSCSNTVKAYMTVRTDTRPGKHHTV